jgi:hypothetical protein
MKQKSQFRSVMMATMFGSGIGDVTEDVFTVVSPTRQSVQVKGLFTRRLSFFEACVFMLLV